MTAALIAPALPGAAVPAPGLVAGAASTAGHRSGDLSGDLSGADLPGAGRSTSVLPVRSVLPARPVLPVRSVLPLPYVLPVPHVLPAPGSAGLSRAELRASGYLVHDFVAPEERWSPGHRGVDLSSAAGATILAPQSGTVSFVGVVVDRPVLVLTHADGLRSTLEPVTSMLAVGDRVAAGDVVAALDETPSSHCAPAWCLHWGVRRGEEYLDPLTLTRVVEPVVLLPLG